MGSAPLRLAPWEPRWGWITSWLCRPDLAFGVAGRSGLAGLLVVSWFVGGGLARTARSLRVADPGSVVGRNLGDLAGAVGGVAHGLKGQLLAVIAFRVFDAVRQAPWVGLINCSSKAGAADWLGAGKLGIMFDDLVAALCTLLLLALAVALRQGGVGVSLLP